MLAFMGLWPAWAIYALVGGICGALGALVGGLFSTKSNKARIVVAVIAFAISRPITEQIVIPQISSDFANADLPKKIDDITTMTRIAINGKSFSYNFDIDPSVSLVSGSQMKAALAPAACGYWKPKFQAGHASSAEYNYAFKDGSSKFVLTSSDCP